PIGRFVGRGDEIEAVNQKWSGKTPRRREAEFTLRRRGTEGSCRTRKSGEWPGCCLLSASSSSSIWSISIGKKRWIRTASVVQCDETNPKKEPLSEARTDERKLHLDEIDKLNGQSFN